MSHKQLRVDMWQAQYHQTYFVETRDCFQDRLKLCNACQFGTNWHIKATFITQRGLPQQYHNSLLSFPYLLITVLIFLIEIHGDQFDVSTLNRFTKPLERSSIMEYKVIFFQKLVGSATSLLSEQCSSMD